MNPAGWSGPLTSYFWQVALHQSVMGVIFYLWAYRLNLPSGQTKRRLLAVLLVLPLVTAAVPGRASIEFGERVAWLNSSRVLLVPLLGGFHVYHVVWLVGGLSVVLTVWQELVPLLRRPKTTTADVPETLVRMARALPGWSRCRVAINPVDSVMVGTSGWPGRPQLIVSHGALATLSDDELAIVVTHEHAHWIDGRWLLSHALFVVRLLQCYSPVAMWVFREYCVEVEVSCDARAVAGRNPNDLARILLGVYRATDRRDVAARGALRKRVDVLMSGGPRNAELPSGTLAAAAVLMLVVLPWLV